MRLLRLFLFNMLIVSMVAFAPWGGSDAVSGPLSDPAPTPEPEEKTLLEYFCDFLIAVGHYCPDYLEGQHWFEYPMAGVCYVPAMGVGEITITIYPSVIDARAAFKERYGITGELVVVSDAGCEPFFTEYSCGGYAATRMGAAIIYVQHGYLTTYPSGVSPENSCLCPLISAAEQTGFLEAIRRPDDRDGDGIPDDIETRVPGPGRTNLYLPDSDGDGLHDGLEDANRNGVHLEPGETDPRHRDTDGDGYEDGIEVLLLSSNPLASDSPVTPFADADGDSLPDSLDPAPENPDADGDRFLDGYEAVMLGLSAVTNAGVKPTLGDVDKNGVLDNGDTQMILNFFADRPTVPGFDFTRTDVDRNGIIDNADAQRSLNFFALIDPYMPVE